MNEICVLAFYFLDGIENPQAEVKRWKHFLEGCDAKSRIYISEEGINAQMSVHQKDFERFLTWLKSEPKYESIDCKVHFYHEHPFPKLTIKYRKQLVAFDQKIDRSMNGKYLTPKEWKEKLDQKDSHTILLDVRNDYEWDVGHFEQADRPNMNTFREFVDFAHKLKNSYDLEKTEVLMCCTGGIRCEIFSPFMKSIGFKNVYQLKGGIIKYGLEVGHEHWRGQLFVFDDRLVVPIDPENTEAIGSCHNCGCSINTYYNCANMDCNKLFISCKSCAESMKGCCSQTCMQAPRVRAFQSKEIVKPFRKLSAEEKKQMNESHRN